MTLFLPMLLHQLLSSQFFSSLSERACFHSIQDTNFQLLNIKNKAKKMLKTWKKICRFSYLSTKLGDLSAAALFARAEAITSPPSRLGMWANGSRRCIRWHFICSWVGFQTKHYCSLLFALLSTLFIFPIDWFDRPEVRTWRKLISNCDEKPRKIQLNSFKSKVPSQGGRLLYDVSSLFN